MYFCGPTVYQRIHVGNARPFVISMWPRNWLALRGYDVTLVENITDINDKIYDAAPGASAQLADQASRWYVEDTDRLGLGRPDYEPKASETVAEIVALIEELVVRGLAYEAGGDVYFRVARFEDYGRLSGQRPDEVQEQEPNPLKEDPRDFALWKTTKPGEDTRWESPLGPRPARLAHRMLGHGPAASRPVVRDPRRRARPRLPAPRERARPVTRGRAGVRAHLDAQRDAAPHRREDVEVAGQHRHAAGGAGRVGSGDPAALLHDRALAQAARLLRGDDGSSPGSGRRLSQPARRVRQRARGRGAVVPSGGRPRRRLQHAGGVGGSARVAEQGRSRRLGARPVALRPRVSGATRAGTRGGSAAAATSRRSARPARTSPRPTGCATRFSPRAGSRATPPTAQRSCPANDGASRARLRPPPGARGAPCGPPRDTRAARLAARARVGGVAARDTRPAGQGRCRRATERCVGNEGSPGRRRVL